MATAPPMSRDYRRPARHVPWYRRLWDLLFRRPGAAASQFRDDQPPRISHDFAQEFFSPAAGDAFDFTVRLEITWYASVQPAYKAHFRQWLEERQEQSRSDLEDVLRSITRRYPAYECSAVEAAISQELAGSHWLTPHDGMTGSVRARVGLDAELRAKYRQADLDEALDARKERAAQREISRIGETITLWQELLDRFAQEDPAPAAIQLAVDTESRQQSLLEGIKQTANANSDPERERLFAMAERALEMHEELGTAQALARFDTNLGHLLRHLGVTDPSGQRSNGHGPADDSEHEPSTPKV